MPGTQRFPAIERARLLPPVWQARPSSSSAAAIRRSLRQRLIVISLLCFASTSLVYNLDLDRDDRDDLA
jgi:hypothetical protein